MKFQKKQIGDVVLYCGDCLRVIEDLADSVQFKAGKGGDLRGMLGLK